ncbi:MAG: methionine synthase [Prevotella sp.]|nr:methionine synthase [Prevotella sp.]
MSIEEQLSQRILILDGAMGTKIQSLGLTGNNDALCLTQPDVIANIHRQYIEAGADIISTNTFSSNRISQQEYGCADKARLMALEGARIARRVADEFRVESLELSDISTAEQKSLNSKHSTLNRIWVAGSMGPTSKSLSLASDMNNPALRTVDFDEMAAAYYEQADALMEGGADLLLLETCYDALNTKAALYAIQQLNEHREKPIQVMVSATINDRSGRTLTGQTLEAFFVSISHYPHLLSFGLNCSFGVSELRPFVEQLATRIPVYLSLHPNAGLPNEMGEYDELPEFTAAHLRQMAEAGLLNIAGGCCGTNEQHIRAISQALKGIPPRKGWKVENLPPSTLNLSGLEPLTLPQPMLTNIGERTNVAGSRKFARLIAEKKYDEALSVARQQIEGGASIIDINMDDAMLDSHQEMQTFCRHISNDPAVGRSVLMIDSSDWPTVLAGLKNAQGKCIVNSISLKNGEEDFLNKARELRRLGAAVVVMAFDEEGQATTFERKTAIAQRAYKLLTTIGFPPQDIIFDVNILSVGTGLKEHQAYAVDFIRAVKWIKENLPLAKTSGGVSNLSFAFRGNNKVREAMHSVFLYHAVRAGLDMAIVNPSMLQVYDDIDPALLKAVEDVILNTDDGATERLIALASSLLASSAPGTPVSSSDEKASSWRDKPIEDRLAYALTKGDSSHLADDIPEALQKYGRPIDVIEKPLMQAMEHIGQLFGEGKMFLPQVVKSAQVMKDAVALLIKEEESGERKEESTHPCVVLATANGDVHDIGKNIVGIVLGCNGFDVVDLGVMVPGETILEETIKRKPCLVGISGLITPSLKEMEKLCQLFQREGLQTPIVVGGATTSALHTAVKLAPLYDGCVIFGGDASQTSLIAKHLQMDAATTIAQIKAEQEEMRNAYEEHHAPLTPYAEANKKGQQTLPQPLPIREGSNYLQGDISAKGVSSPLPDREGLGESLLGGCLLPLIDWRMFLLFWGFKGETLPQLLVNPEAERTLAEGKQYLQDAIANDRIQVQTLLQFEEATRRGNDIVLADGTTLPMLRSQSAAGHYLCLSDYYDEQQPSPIGLFTVVARPTIEPADDAERLMNHALCARLAEAAAEWLSVKSLEFRDSSIAEQTSLNSERSTLNILRVAFGYATCPDHSLKRIVIDRLDAERQLGITLTDHYSIQPSTSICGLFICHPEARYFPVGRIDRDQLADYCRRRGITVAEGEQLLSKYIAH